MSDEMKIPAISKFMEEIGDHEIVGGHYVASIDPASDTPDVRITRVYTCKPVFSDKVIYNFNFNDPKILEMLNKKDEDVTGNTKSI